MRTLDNYENRLIELVPETTVQLALGIEGKDENIATHLYINTSDFFQGLEVGHKVLMDDGKALLTISEVVDEFIVNAKVVHGGAIKSRR